MKLIEDDVKNQSIINSIWDDVDDQLEELVPYEIRMNVTNNVERHILVGSFIRLMRTPPV
jgi:hypothetical protein